jgi:hypothetical protein
VSANELTRTVERFEAQGVDAVEHMERGAFGRPGPSRGSGFDLEVGEQVVQEHHELLPRICWHVATLGYPFNDPTCPFRKRTSSAVKRVDFSMSTLASSR